jgi:DinB family protein
MTRAEIDALIKRYEDGTQLLKEALATVPAAAMQWRPAPGKWSVHEVVCHCADSETNSAMRIRYLVGEEAPAIQGYDQDRWAQRFDYHAFPMDVALAQVEVVRRWTTAFIRRLPDAAWTRAGTHSEMPGESYTAAVWLGIYAEHLEVHARQIRRNVEAYRASGR